MLIPARISTLKNGLVSCWEFDEISGGTAYDSHGSYHANIVNTVIAQPGKLNKAFNFNGTSSYVYCSNPNFAGSGLSISFWINPSNTIGSSSSLAIRILSQYDGEGTPMNGQWVVDMGLNSQPGMLRFILATSAGVGSISSPAYYVELNKWQHIVCVWDGAKLILYRNGVKHDTTVSHAGLLINPSSTLAWGRDYPTMPQNYYQGLFDQTLIYSRALGDEEILQLSEGISYSNL